MKLRTIVFALIVALLAIISQGTAQANGVFVTGHDSDFHATEPVSVPEVGNPIGAQHILQRAIAYVTNGKVNPTILLVTDVTDPQSGPGYTGTHDPNFSRDSRLGMVAAGFAQFEVADITANNDTDPHAVNPYSAVPGGLNLDLKTVDFSQFDVVVVASDFGGWLRQRELDVLNARKAELVNYVDIGGGGLVALAESGQRAQFDPTADPGTTHDMFGFLPTLVGMAVLTQHEEGFTLSPFGESLGLVEEDINHDFSHDLFTSFPGYQIVDKDGPQDDPNSNVISIAAKTIDITPPRITDCTVGTNELWPPNHDLVNVGLKYTIVPGTDPNPTVTVTVYSNEPDLGGDGDDNFSPDAKGFTAGELRLRSERPGQSVGRVYLIVVKVTDIFGNTAICAHNTVVVPHDQSKKSKDAINQLAAAAAAFAEAHNGTPPAGYVLVGDGPVVGPKQ